MDWLFGKKKEEPKTNEMGISIKIDPQNLPKLQKVDGIKMPEKPKFQTKEDIKDETEKMKGKEPFDLDAEFDLSTYQGRFYLQVNKVNPLLFFTPRKRIEEARDELLKY